MCGEHGVRLMICYSPVRGAYTCMMIWLYDVGRGDGIGDGLMLGARCIIKRVLWFGLGANGIVALVIGAIKSRAGRSRESIFEPPISNAFMFFFAYEVPVIYYLLCLAEMAFCCTRKLESAFACVEKGWKSLRGWAAGAARPIRFFL